MLKSDREYSIIVIAVTNEGRFRSRPAKARTLKDECLYLIYLNNSKKQDISCYVLVQNSLRHSLYESPTQMIPRLKRAETASRKKSPSIERQFTRECKLILFLSFFFFEILFSDYATSKC
jgi:hypothetical protein